MLQFFRKIRRKLISDQRIGRYLLYALGEILLVVIGILIALQLNTMKEDRGRRKTELSIYRIVKDQLLDYRVILEDERVYNEHYVGVFEYAATIIERDDRTQIDTLGKITSQLLNYSDFDARGNIYENLANSGEVNLLKNPAITEGLRHLEERCSYINRMENIHYDVVLSWVAPSITSTVKLSTGEVLQEERLMAPEFQNLLQLLLQIMEEKDDVYRSALNELDQVLQLIDQELD